VDGSYLVVSVVLAVGCGRGWSPVVARVEQAPSLVMTFPDVVLFCFFFFFLFIVCLSDAQMLHDYLLA
jgi:hypothetical protein